MNTPFSVISNAEASPAKEGVVEQRAVLAVCTRQRPAMLRECLESVINQKLPVGWQLSIVVVENDTEAMARSTVESLQADSLYPLYYAQEPELGIPFARNLALEEGLKLGCDWFIFIDDDEIADSDWLLNLMAATEKFGADVVQGRINFKYPAEDRWAHLREKNAKGLRKPEGRALRTAATNNVIFSTRLFSGQGMGLRFDTELRFSGLEDNDFFFRAVKQGAKIRYTPKAVVSETVPIERCSLRWLLKRESSFYSSTVYLDKKNKGIKYSRKNHMQRFLRNSLKGVGHFLLSILCLPVDFKEARRHFLMGLLKVAGNMGRVIGLVGGLQNPYKKIEGR